MMKRTFSGVSGRSRDSTVTLNSRSVVAAGCELSITVYVHESSNPSSAVPASTRVAGAKPTPDGSDPPSQLKVYVYGLTPPLAAGRVTERKVPMTNRWSGVSGRTRDSGAALVTRMSRETVAAGCELSVTVYVHGSWNTAFVVPASTRVAGAKPTPGGNLPPAQVKVYVYGATPPLAAGRVTLRKSPMTNRTCSGVSGRARDSTTTSILRETVSAGCELSVTE